MRSPRLAFLACLLAALPAAAGRVGGWRESLSPHFQVFHEASLLPNGFTLDLERMHNRLRTELSLFAPWMANERIKLYLYSGGPSYYAGEFNPPKWSNGFSEYHSRMVVTHDQGSAPKTWAVISHETTHLLLKSYWGEANREPPSWLNEGLAMVEEAPDPDTAERSEWHRSLATLDAGNVIALDRFLPMTPGRDMKEKGAITLWYVQSYALVYYLLRKHSKMQFFNFCRELRDGELVDKALWRAYRIRDAGALEAEWKAWLKLPASRQGFRPLGEKRAPAEPAAAPQASGPKLRQVGFGSTSFQGLIPDEPRKGPGAR